MTTRPRGRPRIGPRVHVYLSEDARKHARAIRRAAPELLSLGSQIRAALAYTASQLDKPGTREKVGRKIP